MARERRERGREMFGDGTYSRQKDTGIEGNTQTYIMTVD